MPCYPWAPPPPLPDPPRPAPPLPRPPRVRRDAAQATLPLVLLSFMSESRRLDNTRMKRELRLRLRYPTVQDGLLRG